MLGVELSPVAIASAGDGLGAVTHARVIGAYTTNYLSLGLGIGTRLQNFGTSGLSIAPSLRLGSLDGLNLELTYTHTLARNRFTDKPTMGFSNVLAKIQVPVARTLALQLDTGLSLDTWAYATLGLRHRLFGDGGPRKLVHQRRVRPRDGRRQDRVRLQRRRPVQRRGDVIRPDDVLRFGVSFLVRDPRVDRGDAAVHAPPARSMTTTRRHPTP